MNYLFIKYYFIIELKLKNNQKILCYNILINYFVGGKNCIYGSSYSLNKAAKAYLLIYFIF